MPDPTPPKLRTLAFGDVEQDVWGAAWLPGPQAHGLVVIGTGGDVRGLEVNVECEAGEGGWRLRGERLELVVEPVAAAVGLENADGVAVASEQPCAVSLALGPDPELQIPGRRAEHRLTVPAEKLDSAREVSAWFEGGEVVAVLALRSRKQRGHDQDAVSAVVIDGEQTTAIVDPRLSTTYAASGRPTRISLELWSDDPEQYPRRFAGESAQRSAEVSGGGWMLRVELLRCHSRGRDGTGVYVLARPG